MAPLKRLEIDWTDMEFAWDPSGIAGAGVDIECFFNVETGLVVHIDDEIQSLLSQMEDEASEDPKLASQPFISVFHKTASFIDAPDWMKESLIEAISVLHANPESSKYVEIPRLTARDRINARHEFTAQLDPSPQREALIQSLREPKPLRSFRETMRNDPELAKRWNEFEANWQAQMITDWLATHGIVPANEAWV